MDAVMAAASGGFSYEEVLREVQRRTEVAREAASAASKPTTASGTENTGTGEHEEDLDGEEEIEIVAEEEVYRAYVPNKLREGVEHPTPIVETTSLAVVTPPDITYTHHLQDIVASGKISGAQLESVLYANMRFNMPKEHYIRNVQFHQIGKDSIECQGEQTLYRPGFYLADGAGVGKGRQIAAIIAEHWRTGGRRALWLSVSTDLKVDAKRDIRSLGLDLEISVYPEGKSVPQGMLSRRGIADGVLFFTYSLLVSNRQGGRRKREDTAEEEAAPGMKLRAKSDFLDNPQSRLRQVVQWLKGNELQESAAPLIVLDECHKAKNLVTSGGNATATGLAVQLLQEELPNAKVMYSSATGATEPLNLAYMARVGHWGYNDMESFLRSIRETGLGAMEMLAMSLKNMGIYVSRTLSYEGVVFRMTQLELSLKQEIMYDRSAEFWQLLFRVFFPTGSKRSNHYETLTDEEKNRSKTVRGNFWSAHMRFFRQMLIACKVPYLCDKINQALAEGKCCVIGLQSTGEAGAKSMGLQDGNTVDELISAPKLVLVNLVKNFLPLALGHLLKKERKTIMVQLKASLDKWVGIESAEQVAAKIASMGEDTSATITEVTNVGSRETRTALKQVAHLDMDNSVERLAERITQERIELARRTGQYINVARELGAGEFEAAQKAEEDDVQARAEMEAAGHVDVVVSDSNTDGSSDSGSDDDLEMSLASKLRRRGQPPPHRRQSASHPLTPLQENVVKQSGNRIREKNPINKSIQLRSSPPKRPFPEPEAPQVDPTKRLRTSPQAAVTATAAAARMQPQVTLEPTSKPGIYELTCLTDSDDDDLVTEGQSAAAAAGVKPEPQVQRKADGRSQGCQPLTPGWANEPMMDERALHEDPEVAATTKLICFITKMVLRAIDAMELPANPLDEITTLCGGPDKVAEMTGRSMQLVQGPDGSVQYKRRVEEVSQKDINLKEMADFMDGRKLVAIISDAASTGISLHADMSARNRRQRVHFTLELPWSADKAIQQFGRSHRSNQAEKPIYDLIVTKCGGERRFASCATRRLMSLGALTKGDRRAMGAGGDLKEFDIDEECGNLAIKRVLQDIMGYTAGPMAGVPHPKLPERLRKNEFGSGHREYGFAHLFPEEIDEELRAFYLHMQECCLAVGLLEDNGQGGLVVCSSARYAVGSVETSRTVKLDRFLNRLLGLRIEEQEALFRYFEDTYTAEVKAARSRGEMSGGVVTLRGYTSLRCVATKDIHIDAASKAKTTITTLAGNRRVSWEMALASLEQNLEDGQGRVSEGFKVVGFYADRGRYGGNPYSYILDRQGRKQFHVVLVTYRMGEDEDVTLNNMRFNLIRPFGTVAGFKSNSVMYYEDLKLRFRPIDQAKAEELWRFWHCLTERTCVHGFNCTREDGKCTVGMKEELSIIEGAVLPIWRLLMDKRKQLEAAAQPAEGGKKKPVFQVAKVELTDGEDQGKTVVGMLMEPRQVSILIDTFEARAQSQLPSTKQKKVKPEPAAQA